jgi:hypothetical protein
LGILHQKANKKEVVDKEKEIRRQEKEARTTQRATTVANANIMRIQRYVESREITIFNCAWSLANVKEVGDRLHRQIATNVLAQMPFSSNLNFGNTT